jgi:hypothetical protein
MKRRFQIVVQRPGPRELHGEPLSVWTRFRMMFAGLATVIVLLGVLVASFILGSVIAAVFCILILIAIAIFMIKAALRRSRD